MLYNEFDELELRKTYAQVHSQMIDSGLPIILVTADFTFGMGLLDFSQKYPDNFINMGIAEQNMASFAAGLAVEGFIPFIHTFGAFASRRALDQIFISGAYAQLNVNVCGADPGFTSDHNGGTHMAMEDVAIFRTIPNALIVEPTDSTMLKSILPLVAAHPTFSYIRLARKKAIKIYGSSEKFELGRAKKLREGTDVTLITYGRCVSDTLNAAEILSQRGIDARVIDMFTIKPLDVDMVLNSAARTKLIITIENATKSGGLGGAICELISEQKIPIRVLRLGREDIFGEVGYENELKKKYKLTTEEIVLAVEREMEEGN